MKTIATLLAGSAAAAFALAAPAQAAQVGGSCGASAITNVTVGTYLGCSGAYEGNDSNSQTEVMNALAGLGQSLSLTGTWGYDSSDKSDSAGSGVFTSNPGGNAGTLTFDNPMYGIFAVALKAADFYSIFVFDGGLTGITSFNYTTNGVAYNSNNNNGAGLSHASYYSFDGGTNEVPEPLTLLGTAAALGMGTLMRRRSEEA